MLLNLSKLKFGIKLQSNLWKLIVSLWSICKWIQLIMVSCTNKIGIRAWWSSHHAETYQDSSVGLQRVYCNWTADWSDAKVKPSLQIWTCNLDIMTVLLRNAMEKKTWFAGFFVVLKHFSGFVAVCKFVLQPTVIELYAKNWNCHEHHLQHWSDGCIFAVFCKFLLYCFLTTIPYGYTVWNSDECRVIPMEQHCKSLVKPLHSPLTVCSVWIHVNLEPVWAKPFPDSNPSSLSLSYLHSLRD